MSACIFFLKSPLILTVTSSRKCYLIKQAVFRPWDLIFGNSLPQLYSIFVQVEFFSVFPPRCFSGSRAGFEPEAKWWWWFPVLAHWYQIKHILAFLPFPLWGHMKWSLHCLWPTVSFSLSKLISFEISCVSKIRNVIYRKVKREKEKCEKEKCKKRIFTSLRHKMWWCIPPEQSLHNPWTWLASQEFLMSLAQTSWGWSISGCTRCSSMTQVGTTLSVTGTSTAQPRWGTKDNHQSLRTCSYRESIISHCYDCSKSCLITLWLLVNY